MKTWFCTAPVLLLITACDGESIDGDAIDGWLGAEPHLRVIGAIQGDDLDIDVTGTDAEDLGTLFCERNYVKGDNSLEKVEVKYNFTYNDQPAELEITVEGPDAVGEYTIGDTAVLELKIETADETEFENEGDSGTITVDEFSGEADGDGLIPDNTGTYGGFVDAVLDDGNTFQASYTANCGENDF